MTIDMKRLRAFAARWKRFAKANWISNKKVAIQTQEMTDTAQRLVDAAEAERDALRAEVERLKGPPIAGTMACPICGVGVPHNHTEKEQRGVLVERVAMLQDAAVSVPHLRDLASDLQEEVCGMRVEATALCSRIAVLEAREAKLRKALEWYADEANWDDGKPGYASCEEGEHEGECDCDSWEGDYGGRARAALAAAPAEPAKKGGE